ncbi:MAG: DUF1284 domain-containing protein [Clostridium perfringens]|nr:DUF1284 domain-containing protein [Clostridium perfringens]
MILRPHHLLCTQSYEGKGYSKEFIDNMNKNIEFLRREKGFKVKIQSVLDNLCISCPNNQGKVCSTENKVKTMDEKVLKYFDLKEDIYVYKEVINLIQKEITKEILEDICGQCQWYKYGMCKKIILGKY